MNSFLICLFIIILLLIFISISYVLFYNKINETIIRIDEAENRIDSNLRDKFDLLSRSVTIIKNIKEIDKDAFKDIIKLRSRKISNFELDRTLVNSQNEFLSLYQSNKEFRENDELYRTTKQLELIDSELVTLRNYYNGNITEYNKLIKKFPTNIIAKMKKYQEKPFYDLKDRSDDDYEDFKL